MSPSSRIRSSGLPRRRDDGRRFGHQVELLDAEAVRGEVHSPLFLGGLWQRNGAATVNPAKLCWGLRAAALDLGVRIHEQAGVKRLRRRGDGITLELADGALQARQALLATSADRGLLAQMRRRVIPVYDYVLVTEPLNRSQLDSVGWRNRQGVGDSANQFHYYRLTADKPHPLGWLRRDLPLRQPGRPTPPTSANGALPASRSASS